jgi:arylsulfatase A-like enzyme
MATMIVALGLALSALAQTTSRDPGDRPNLVVIMVDDLGAAGVSSFGNPHFKTPEIDRLAAEGFRLTDFHASGALCSPTRAGLLTGRYQQRAGIEGVIIGGANHPEHRKGLQPVEATFAERLKAAGYATGLVGKWHQGYAQEFPQFHPTRHGFDEFTGYHSGNIDYVSHVGDHLHHDWWHGEAETHEEGYTTHLINRYAVDFIRRHRAEPFCLYVAHEAVHNPVQVPGDPVQRTEAGWNNRWKPANLAERVDKFRGMLLPVDDGVGQIRRTLEELGLERNTLVLFFSDNGASTDFPSGDPGLRAGKGAVYEGGHREPFIAWWPGRIAPGGSSHVPAITIDVMPTLLALGGATADPARPLDGLDLSPLLLGTGTLPDRPLYWAALNNNGSRAEAMREGPWKLVVSHPGATPGSFENPRAELYNLADDPSESTDLASRDPDRTAAMQARLTAWYAETRRTVTPQPGGWPDAAVPDSVQTR